MFILEGVKDNLLVAQIFGHGDDLRSIKKLILIILITHVSFARAALICKGRRRPFVYFGSIYQNLAQQDLDRTNYQHSNTG